MQSGQNCSVVENRDGSSSTQAYSTSTFTTKRKLKGKSVVQHDIEEEAVHVKVAVVVNKVQLPELIQEDTDS